MRWLPDRPPGSAWQSPGRWPPRARGDDQRLRRCRRDRARCAPELGAIHDGADLSDPAAIAAMMRALRRRARNARHPRQQCRDPARLAGRQLPARKMGRDHRHQPVGGIPHHPRRACRRCAPRVGAGSSTPRAPHSLVASPNKSAYVAAKHGVAGFTKSVALEAARDGVTVNCISPGYVWTTLVENQIPDTMKARGLTREQVMNDVLLAAQPTKQFVTPEQVAALARVPVPRRGRRRSPARTSAWMADGPRNDRPAPRIAVLGLAFACASCCGRAATGALLAPASDWRAVATDSDREAAARLARRRSPARSPPRAAAGHGADDRREGALLEPDAALGGPSLPNGDYRCRVIKLGARVRRPARLISLTPLSPAGSGQSGAAQTFAKLTGSQRQVGAIFPGDALRQVFLGTLVLGDEARAMQYGSDEERDVAGFRRTDRPGALADGDAPPAFRIADRRDGAGAGALGAGGAEPSDLRRRQLQRQRRQQFAALARCWLRWRSAR